MIRRLFGRAMGALRGADATRDHLAAVENAIQSLGDGVVLYGPDDRVVWSNRRFRELHALTPLAYRIGAHIGDILRAAVASGEVSMPAEGVEAWIARRLEERRRSESYTLLLRDGRWLRIADRRTPDGSLVSIHSDVTELKAAEAAAEHARADLALQTATLSSLVDNLPIGVTLVDQDGCFMAFNRAFLAVNGIPADTFKPGDRFADCIRNMVERGDFGHDADADTLVAQVMTKVMSGVPQHYERVLSSAGRVVAVHRAPLPGGGFVSAYIDVTEARRREADVGEARALLERQTAMLSTLVENLEVGVSLVDAQGRLVALNSAYLELFGVPRGTFGVGDTYEACIRYMVEHGDHEIVEGEDLESTIRRVVANAMRPVPQKFERKLRNGRTIEIRRAPLPGGGFVTTYIDETDARRREADLTRIQAELEAQAAELAATASNLHAANAAKSMFLANMSHELRTPLNAILGFSEIMRDAMLGPLDQRYSGYAKDIHLSGAYLLRLINDILDTSKIDAGQMHLEQNRIDLAELIGECERLVLERARIAAVSLVCAIGRSFPPIVGDRLRLKQALLNLLVNAVKFTPAGGSVRVSASGAKPHGIDIAIIDTGIGMEPASIARALEPFQQLDNRLARRYEGTGLGLPLAKSLIELHGGKLTIESAAGKGTTARIWLPPERLLDETPVARDARRAGHA
ncbi:MAG TPA: PAS-domain containing protein [Stellaceae bacterium]|nr:PAS-domain containing protein [Stellaceae bacterium]